MQLCIIRCVICVRKIGAILTFTSNLACVTFASNTIRRSLRHGNTGAYALSPCCLTQASRGLSCAACRESAGRNSACKMQQTAVTRSLVRVLCLDRGRPCVFVTLFKGTPLFTMSFCISRATDSCLALCNKTVGLVAAVIVLFRELSFMS